MSAPDSLRARLPAPLRRIDPAVLTAFACILALLLIGSLYSPKFLSVDYILQQLKVASFLGVVAARSQPQVFAKVLVGLREAR